MRPEIRVEHHRSIVRI